MSNRKFYILIFWMAGHSAMDKNFSALFLVVAGCLLGVEIYKDKEL